MNFNKIIRIGTNDAGNVYCKIKFRDGKLSISGVEGPLKSGNARGSCGQINMSMKPRQFNSFADGWDKKVLAKFLEYWDDWHLNDMKAGTPAQEAYLKAHKDEFPGYPVNRYNWACETLGAVGLHPDNGYKYGSAWLKQEVPESVISFMQSLPDTDKAPAWI